jgi:IclR family acetate operon transcriptional repressor
VSKAVRILLRVAEDDDGASATEVSDALGIPVATTYHLMNTLLAERMLSKDASRRYHLGPSVGALTDAIQRRPGPPEWLLGPLRGLASETGETAYLSGWVHDDVTVLATLEGSHAVRVRGLHTGFTGHAHARASGKIFLAFSERSTRDRYLARHPLEPLTTNSITDTDLLHDELARIALQGYALDIEEFTVGVRGVSAPVLRDGIATHAYTVAVPSDRFERERPDLIEAVQRAAAASDSDESKVSA